MGIISKLSGNGLEVFVREIAETEQNKPIAYSVQVRITDSKMGILLPETFMPVAEKTAKARQILLWSVKKSIDIMDKFFARDIDFDFFAFYCPETFITVQPALEEFISLVNQSEKDFSLFAFYISPTLLISQNEDVIKNIEELRSLGVRFIVLNFGCEGFPLSKVLKAPFDMVVLDEFMNECLCGAKEEQDYAVSIIDMAKKLGLSVIADNVKTQAMLEKIASLCAFSMGDLLGKYKKDRYVRRR